MNLGLKRALVGFIALDCVGLVLLAHAADLHPAFSAFLCTVHGFVAFGVLLSSVLRRLHRADRVRFAALVCGVLFVGLLLAAFTYIAASQPDYLAFAPEERYGFQDCMKVHLALLACTCLIFLLIAEKPDWITYIATHKAFALAQVLLLAVWITAFTRVLSTDDFPPSDILPEGCAALSLDASLSLWPAGDIMVEQLDESRRPVRTTTFSVRNGVSVTASPPDSYCLVTGKHRYTFLDANLRRGPPSSHISDWLKGTSMISAWASLLVLLFWGLTLALSHLRWRRFCGLRFEGIWRGPAGEPFVEVDGEIYRVRLPPNTKRVECGAHSVLFATLSSEESPGPYRGALETLHVKRLYAGRWSELEEQHRVNLRGLAILVHGVLWVLSATAFELIFV